MEIEKFEEIFNKYLKEIKIDKSKLSNGSEPISGAPWSCPYGLRAVFWKK